MKQLVEILDQELNAFNNFLKLLDEQHKQIVSRNLTELNKTNSDLDLLSNRARDFEKKRTQIVKMISGKMNLDKKDIKLQDLLPHLDNISRSRLHQLREAIHNTHNRINEKSARNKELIEKSRKLIFETMKLIGSRPSPVYAKPGPARDKIREGSLLNRSV